MSTFKRLFNVGKGKAKVTSKNLSTGVSGGTDGMRHAAADAAEALADVIRPDEGLTREQVLEQELRSQPRRTRVADEPLPESPVDVEEVDPEPQPTSKGPRKRTL